jgi:RNA polymerase sigma-70 factor, ECF subfamily
MSGSSGIGEADDRKAPIRTRFVSLIRRLTPTKSYGEKTVQFRVVRAREELCVLFGGHECSSHGHMGENDEEDRGMSEAAATLVQADPDEDIARAIRDGDHHGAVWLAARRHGKAIGRLCMALVGAQAEAEDLLQETLVAAHDAFGDWRGDGTVKAFLFGIARKRCARHVEKRSRRDARLRLVYDRARDADAEELLELRRRAERARAALETIRPSEREALLLRYESDLSYREVGAACGIDEAAARKRVSRAIHKLREALRGEE